MVWFCIVGIVAFAVFVISKMLFPNWMKDHPWVGATAIFIDIGMLIGYWPYESASNRNYLNDYCGLYSTVERVMCHRYTW